ncbi:hypothetical protein [Bartonella choladocola]|uniref:hypothetical protein n=1 Tax=Bartonella choladocola TaxID=2750995 RepID=UPI003B5283A3
MFNFFKKKPPSTFGNSSQNSKLIDTVISPNVNLFAVINNDNVIYLNENMIGFGKKDNEGDENFNGRVVNFIFLNKKNKIEAFIALNEEYQYIFYDQNLLLMTLNEIVKDVYIYILKKFNIIEPTLNYESKYIYTFRLLRKEKEFLLGNTMGNIGYLINRTRILRGIPSQLSQNM